MEKSESKFGDLCIIHIGYPWGWSWFHKSVSHAPLILTARSRLMCMKQSRDQKIQSVVFIESSLLSCRHKSLPFDDSFANQSIWWSYEFANTDHNLTSSYNLKNHINFPFQARSRAHLLLHAIRRGALATWFGLCCWKLNIWSSLRWISIVSKQIRSLQPISFCKRWSSFSRKFRSTVRVLNLLILWIILLYHPHHQVNKVR